MQVTDPKAPKGQDAQTGSAHVDPDSAIQSAKAVVDFLCGLDFLEGVSFGEIPAAHTGKFWWRIPLARAFTALFMAVDQERRDNTAAQARAEQAQARVAELEGLAWIDGIPPKPWSSEWFIAETVDGDKVALFPLPEEWSYDFKTSDETYFCASRIKRWMQFPDSEYVSFAAARIATLSTRAEQAEARVVELEARELLFGASACAAAREITVRAEAAEARERALLASNNDTRSALVENASLRTRLKTAEAALATAMEYCEATEAFDEEKTTGNGARCIRARAAILTMKGGAA